MSEKLPELERRAQISLAAYRAAQTHGFMEFNRRQVATEAQCATGTVSKYYDEGSLRRAVLVVALKRYDYDMLVHAVVGPYKDSIRLPPRVRRKLIDKLTK